MEIIDKEEVVAKIRDIGSKSINIFSDRYFLECLRDSGYSLKDVQLAFKKGLYVVDEAFKEKGNNSVIGFTVAFKFKGYSEACHVRGWAVIDESIIELRDQFNNADLCQ